jgi:hypothetical protein
MSRGKARFVVSADHAGRGLDHWGLEADVCFRGMLCGDDAVADGGLEEAR